MSSYKHEGRKLPSVTTIIGDCSPKDWGPPWGANCVVDWIRQNCRQAPFITPETAYLVFESDLESARKNFRDVSQTALDIGSEVHKSIETFTKILIETGKPLVDCDLHDEIVKDLSPQAANSFGAFLEWADENEFVPIEAEKTVYGPTWAGTLDVECMLNKKHTIIDYKSSKGHYLNTHGPQIAAYRSCVPEAESHGVLRLDKETGEPNYKDYTNRYAKDLATFRAMVNLYFLRHPKLAKAAGVPF